MQRKICTEHVGDSGMYIQRLRIDFYLPNTYASAEDQNVLCVVHGALSEAFTWQRITALSHVIAMASMTER